MLFPEIAKTLRVYMTRLVLIVNYGVITGGSFDYFSNITILSSSCTIRLCD
jgi:hypothetical protein